MKNQYSDVASQSPAPRSRVIKAGNASGREAARAYDQDGYSAGGYREGRAGRAIDRASERFRDQPRAAVEQARQESSIRQRVKERKEHRAPAPPAREQIKPSLRWYQTKWFKFSSMGALLALMLAAAFLKPIDTSSESQIDSALTRALIGFGIARTLNGVISVAQGTEFAVQPAGVGVNFSPGEILDPINDLVERFSWVMLVATSSLGIQKILLDVSSWIGVSFMLAGAALFWLLTRMQSGAASSLARFASRLLLVMLLVRFLVPLGAIANDWVYRQFLQPQFEASSQQLEAASERIREISARQSEVQEAPESLRQRARNFYQSMTSKFDFEGMLQDYRASAEDVSEHAVNLIVVFLLQTILFPLVFLYIVYRVFRYLLLPPAS
jgi:ABC-type multidrug transport system fused ATPase/permease subunit